MAKHGHHGGSWKVAYADFTTTMMALFLVLWLTAQDTKVKEAIERAFRNPFSSLTKEGVGIIPNPEASATHEEKGNFDSPSAVQLELLRRVTEDLAKLLQSSAEDQQAVKLEVTPEGLRINVFDRSHQPIFEPDSIEFTPYGSWVFSTMAWVVARYQTFVVELEGHTETGTQPQRPDYTPWELSADRANATRRLLLRHGMAPTQVFKVSGYGETQPMSEVPSSDESNRRVTVLLRVRPGSRLGSDTGEPESPPAAPPSSP
jgi:chemotaxis protein MotB